MEQIRIMNTEQLMNQNEKNQLLELEDLLFEQSKELIHLTIAQEREKSITKSLHQLQKDSIQKAKLEAIATRTNRTIEELLIEQFNQSRGKILKELFINNKALAHEAKKEAILLGSLDEEDLKKSYVGYYENNQLLGILEFLEESDTIEISGIYSKETGRQIGSKMLESLFEYARQMGIHAIELQVKTNNRAKDLYSRCGFEYTKDEDGEPVISNGSYFMSKSLEYQSNLSSQGQLKS